MLRQYQRIKSLHPDSILMFRLGDFYEMFYKDAELASSILGITLTSRNKNAPDSVPLCGVPYHSVEPYIVKLLKEGHKVALCDQVEDPKAARGIVRREVTRVFTPGVIADGLGLEAACSNNLASVYINDGAIGLACADASTGFFEASIHRGLPELNQELARLEPREVLVPSTDGGPSEIEASMGRAFPDLFVTRVEAERFDPALIQGLEGAAVLAREMPEAARAAGGLMSYLAATQMGRTGQMTGVRVAARAGVMRMDEETRRNLELTETMRDRAREGSLLWALDRTKTAGGARLMRRWVLAPLTDVAGINARLDSVEAIAGSPALMRALGDALGGVYDIERIASRAASGVAGVRDLVALARSLDAAAEIRGLLFGTEGLLSTLARSIDDLPELRERIARTLVDEPPLSAREGGLIRQGFCPELDGIRQAVSGSRQVIAGMEESERKSTGINSLKIRFNRVFGYYIEITNANRDRVPPRYIRRQTLANAERFVTPKLKEHEERVLGGEERARAMEFEIFASLREEAGREVASLQRTAEAAATLDALASFARVASEYDYSRPSVDDSLAISIRDGRHPIVERLCADRFVPNDVTLNGDDLRMLMITGPNMAGKSTVMRQTALIALMAQIGSFVPARGARIGVVDRIFTRVGASDALAQGRSTFMVEMSEAAVILREAGPRSLVVIDEIGRGTSTFDGLAIAWAVAEDLHDRVKGRTMFATHYHELTELALTRPSISNFHVAVREWNGKVVFLRKLTPGSTSHSYGIQVASLAGLPDAVISRAREVLANLEAGEFDEAGRPRIGSSSHAQQAQPRAAQYRLFTASAKSEVERMLGGIDANSVTPLEALNILHELAAKVENGRGDGR
ncbi:MAG: DNA mismatch repair protein MutS [Proteobacteria bacterium]|nr:DNA mismatch repair protein MutS [Pseudomonadota bacterium]